MSSHKINFFLGIASSNQPLLMEAKALLKLQRIFAEIAPSPLAKYCSLGQLNQGQLTLYAANAAIAAKLKQTLPALLLQFQTRGVEVTSFSVAVQARNITIQDFDKINQSVSEKMRRPASISTAGLTSLEGLSSSLHDSSLKNAVTSLINQAKRQKPERQ
jgi:hypothetical protein